MPEREAAWAFVGTYTDDDEDKIFSFRMDPETGHLKAHETISGGENPSFLSLHPTGEFLYVNNEGDSGAVTTFSLNREKGTVTQLNRQPTEGTGPCYCRLDATGKYLFVAHYAGGSVSLLPVNRDGSLDEVTNVIDHEGSGPDPDRQTAPHPHSIVPGPDNQFVYAPDLGTDHVAIYEFDVQNGTFREADTGPTELHAGAGPRHLEFHPNGRYAYLVNELDSTLTAFERNSTTGELVEIETTSTLPPGVETENYPADIHVHPSGHWIYASNRGHDSIVVFEHNPTNGHIHPLDHESTKGEWPRDIALDPTGSYLYAGNRQTGNIVGFRIGDDGRLTAINDDVELQDPACITLASVV